MTIEIKANGPVIVYGAVYYAVQGGSNVRFCEWSPRVWPSKWKITEQYFPVALFIMLHKVVLPFKPINFREWQKRNKKKLTEQYFALELFSTLYKVVLNLDSVNEIYEYDHPDEN